MMDTKAIPVYSADDGFQRLLKKLEKQHYFIDHVELVNMSRYLIVHGTLNGEQHNLLITFKNEVFRQFGKLFLKGSNEEGDTINNDDIKTALSKEVKQIFIIFA